MAAQLLTDRIESLPTDQLRDILCSLMNDFRPQADAVFAAAMRVAEARLASADFLALCSCLEGAA